MDTIRNIYRDYALAWETSDADLWLQISHEFVLVFAGHVFQRIADLVDHAELNLGLGKDRVDRLRETGQAVNAGNPLPDR